jgi:hypothetical protein
MVEAIRAQAQRPDAYPLNWTKWGGDAARKLGEGTGFFTKLKKDGRWMLLDPDGCAFFSQGPDCVVARADARVDGLEPLLAYDPGDDPVLVEPMDHDWGENDRGRGRLISFERANLMRAGYKLVPSLCESYRMVDPLKQKTIKLLFKLLYLKGYS